MSRRGVWSGVVLGLALGAVLGIGLLNSRDEGFSFGGRNHGGHGSDLGNGAVSDSSGARYRMALNAQLNNDRTNAIVLATREVAPAVVSINVVQAQSYRTP